MWMCILLIWVSRLATSWSVEEMGFDFPQEQQTLSSRKHPAYSGGHPAYSRAHPASYFTGLFPQPEVGYKAVEA